MIRNARLEDIKKLVELNHQVQKVHARAFPEIFKTEISNAELEDFFENILKAENHYIFVGEFESEVKGYCWVENIVLPESPFTHPISKLYIQHISVDVNARKTGIGTNLIEEVRKLSKDLKCSHIALDVWDFNEQSQSFFTKCGFNKYNQLMWLR